MVGLLLLYAKQLSDAVKNKKMKNQKWVLFIATYDQFGELEYTPEGNFATEAEALGALGNRIGYPIEI